MIELITNFTFITVLLGVSILGVSSGVLGVFALLRDQSLLGDAISHAMLPGIACAFLLTHSKNPLVLLGGGAVAGCIGALLIPYITRHTVIKKDAALGMVLAVFFGVGLMLMTCIQKKSIANQAILNKFLFGDASTLLRSDVYLMAGFAAIIVCVVWLFWKELLLATFDPLFAKTSGFNVQRIEQLLIGLLICAIAIGLQTVGVVLMSSMIVAPAAAARQWTSSLRVMAILSAFFGVCAGVSGCIVSSLLNRIPTGPAVVIALSAIVIFSLLCAPHRGILWNRVRA